MFKAIGKWGSHVKARIKIPFLTHLFGSKSTDYSGMHDDEEEIFSDAREDLDDLSDLEVDTTDAKAATSIVNGHLALPGQTSSTDGQSVIDKALDGSSIDSSVHKSTEDLIDVSLSKANEIGSSHSDKSDISEHSDDDDHHHISHSDKKKIIKSDSKANGLTKSSSTSTFKKVHRRISSLTQKQYSKIDKNPSGNTEQKVNDSTDGDEVKNVEITEESKPDNKATGITKSPSSSTFKKVHRRINSLTQKQYSKFDNDQHGDTENSICNSTDGADLSSTENTVNYKSENNKTNGVTKSPSTSSFKKVHRRISSLTQKPYNKFDANQNGDTEHIIHDVQDDVDNKLDNNTNGISKSPSTSTFKKVHRRISSLTQKQYSKFDNNQNGDTEQIICDAPDGDELESTSEFERTEIIEVQQKEKKPSRRKKIAKRTRRSIRGSWKWMKRGMLGYAQAFNAPTFFVLNVSGASAFKRY